MVSVGCGKTLLLCCGTSLLQVLCFPMVLIDYSREVVAIQHPSRSPLPLLENFVILLYPQSSRLEKHCPIVSLHWSFWVVGE
jgi:hypothetical protein